MSKQLKTIAFTVMLAVLASGSASAATDSDVVAASAQIAASISLETAILQHQFPGPVTTSVTSMTFNGLAPNGFGGMDSPRYFTVYLTGHTQQLPYQITQTGQDMTNGSVTLPDGAQFVTPIYVASDNGGASLPAGAVLGAPGSWVSTNKLLYDSENAAAQERTIQAIYALRGDPSLGAGNFVPANQPAGSYTGSVTFTVTV